MNRRTFLRCAFATAAAIPAGTACYGAFEAGRITVSRRSIPIAGLPKSFDGFRIAFLADIHHGPFTDEHLLRQIVRTTNLLDVDLIALGGDYILRDRKYIAPCFEALSELRAKHGIVGVMGNHDYWHGVHEVRRGFQRANVVELTNAGLFLANGTDRLRIAGVDDHWEGTPRLAPCVAGLRRDEPCVLISHNPDFAEGIDDPRVKLVLSGHTHGGQIVMPGTGLAYVPSAYGTKYLRGLCDAPQTKVYVSRGLGNTVAPIRLGSRPELTEITLQAA
jgi:hypothetical protein